MNRKSHTKTTGYSDQRGWVVVEKGQYSAGAYYDRRDEIRDNSAVYDRFIESQRRSEIQATPRRVVQQETETAKVFEKLAMQWYSDTMRQSSFMSKILHPAYQKIIGLGEKAIPFILREPQDSASEWFWALEHIARENPVGAEIERPSEMARIWIAWGKKNRYL